MASTSQKHKPVTNKSVLPYFHNNWRDPNHNWILVKIAHMSRVLVQQSCVRTPCSFIGTFGMYFLPYQNSDTCQHRFLHFMLVTKLFHLYSKFNWIACMTHHILNWRRLKLVVNHQRADALLQDDTYGLEQGQVRYSTSLLLLDLDPHFVHDVFDEESYQDLYRMAVLLVRMWACNILSTDPM